VPGEEHERAGDRAAPHVGVECVEQPLEPFGREADLLPRSGVGKSGRHGCRRERRGRHDEGVRRMTVLTNPSNDRPDAWGAYGMDIEGFSFGEITIDGVRWERDVVIDRGEVRKRKKKPSRRYRERFGHTPLSVDEAIPWACERLVVGTGAHGALPVMDDVKREAKRRDVELVTAPTAQAIEALHKHRKRTNAILHVTC
jgi:hypothetical protein